MQGARLAQACRWDPRAVSSTGTAVLLSSNRAPHEDGVRGLLGCHIVRGCWVAFVAALCARVHAIVAWRVMRVLVLASACVRGATPAAWRQGCVRLDLQSMRRTGWRRSVVARLLPPWDWERCMLRCGLQAGPLPVYGRAGERGGQGAPLV